MSNVSVPHKSKLQNLLNYRLRVITKDARVYIGEFMAFDKHMNMVLSDCIEQRISENQLKKLKNGDKNIKLETRTLGFIILRGENILSSVVESQPLLTKKDRINLQKRSEKQLQNQRKKVKGVIKPISGHSSQLQSSENKVQKPNGFHGNITQQPRSRFQPPPGFKKR